MLKFYGMVARVLLIVGVMTTSAPGVQTLVGVGPEGFFDINPVTGVCTLVGKLHPDPNLFQSPSGLAARLSDGKLFVWNNVDYGVLSYNLSTIDQATGRATVLRNYFTAIPIQSLAFSPEGKLYGGASNLYRFDDTTGQETLLAQYPGRRIDGMDFSPDGQLFALDVFNRQLLTIDPANGSITSTVNLIGRVGLAGSLVFTPEGTLWGVEPLSSTSRLYQINPVTGVITERGALSTRILGFDYVPEPSTLLMAVGGGLVVLWRKRMPWHASDCH